jgi:hypothetical protein
MKRHRTEAKSYIEMATSIERFPVPAEGEEEHRHYWI